MLEQEICIAPVNLNIKDLTRQYTDSLNKPQPIELKIAYLLMMDKADVALEELSKYQARNDLDELDDIKAGRILNYAALAYRRNSQLDKALNAFEESKRRLMQDYFKNSQFECNGSYDIEQISTDWGIMLKLLGLRNEAREHFGKASEYLTNRINDQNIYANQIIKNYRDACIMHLDYLDGKNQSEVIAGLRSLVVDHYAKYGTDRVSVNIARILVEINGYDGCIPLSVLTVAQHGLFPL